jgi:hypothetical protein
MLRKTQYPQRTYPYKHICSIWTKSPNDSKSGQPIYHWNHTRKKQFEQEQAEIEAERDRRVEILKGRQGTLPAHH